MIAGMEPITDTSAGADASGVAEPQGSTSEIIEGAEMTGNGKPLKNRRERRKIMKQHGMLRKPRMRVKRSKREEDEGER